MVLVAVSGSAPAEGLASGQGRAPFGRMKRAGGGELDPASLAGRNAYVLAFIDTRCPASNDYSRRLADFARQNEPRGVALVAIHADPHPSAGEAAEAARRAGLPFPVLMDAGAALAEHVGARVTPEVFVFDGGWTLRYRGRVDEDRLGSAVPSADLQAAVDAVLAGRPPRLAHTEAFGCPIHRGASQRRR
jgi:peroxiredoxin